MKFYEEKFFNRRNWMLDNLYKLKLNAEEFMIILLIDFMNEYHENISMDSLSQKSNLSKQQLDEVIMSLVAKGYLRIVNVDMKPHFDIEAIFEATKNVIVNSDIYELFELELGKVLSQREVNIISEWLRLYDYDTIVDALRTTLANDKKSFAYIDKVLAAGEKND